MTRELVHALASVDGAIAPVLHVLGSPGVMNGHGWCPIAASNTRLLAFLAVNAGPIDRHYAAMRLWPDADETRAAGNLRSALWRVNALGIDLVEANAASVGLSRDVEVDIRLLGEWAARMIAGTHRPMDLQHASWNLEQLELLPGCYDDWILLERERLRQRVLHALEILGTRLITDGRCAEAVEVALIAVQADPLRESAERVLVSAHLAEGNRCEAQRRFIQHRDLVRAELGVEPSPEFRALVAPPVTPRTETA